MTKYILSVEELLSLNETMVGRGVPNQDDGVGYNKADYGVCSTYFYGLSDAQIADLAKRLVKYSNTQLNIDREILKDTAEHYAELVKDKHRNDGVSILITEDGTFISFRYNKLFIDVIKSQPKRQYDAKCKQWIVPNSDAVTTLKSLEMVGADVNNALEYISTHPLTKSVETVKETVLTKFGDNTVFLKFDYNKVIIDEIRKMSKNERKWNSEHKYWSISQDGFDNLRESLEDFVEFKVI